MKNLYKSPELELIYFLEQEVLSISGIGGGLPLGDEDFVIDDSPL